MSPIRPDRPQAVCKSNPARPSPFAPQIAQGSSFKIDWDKIPSQVPVIDWNKSSAQPPKFEFSLPNPSVNGKGTPPVRFSRPHTSSTGTAPQPSLDKSSLFDFISPLTPGNGQETSSTASTGSDSTPPVASAMAAVVAEGPRPLAFPSGSLTALMKEQTMDRRRRLLGRPDTEHENIHEVTTAPIFTETARNRAETNVTSPDGEVFSQYGLLAGDASEKQSDELYYYNVAAPSSIFICGSQGSGKSHTLSCLLENCLFSSDANELPRPLTGLVFHYDTFVSDREGSPCEAAFLSSNPMVRVRVLCAPTNIATIRRTYARLPNVTIEPLSIKEQDLTTKRMMDLMAVKRGDNIPLYMHVINRILRDLRLEQQRTGTSFKYQAFKMMLDREDLTDSQRVPLQQRLETLESFMAETQATSTGRSQRLKAPPKPVGNEWTPRAGQLTIVDLSCPCVTAEGACSLFNICLSLFLEQDSSLVGRVIALDEAHKYMNESGEASALTELLLSTIRLQRHLGARVIISTQEPTVSPKLLDLCSATIVHRFTSPEWLRALQKHLAGVSEASRLLEQAQGLGVRGTISSGDEDSVDEVVDRLADGVDTMKLNGRKSQHAAAAAAAVSLFAQIVELHVGEALLFSPNAILDVGSQAKLKKLSNGVLKVRIRSRVTLDGGRSVMAG